MKNLMWLGLISLLCLALQAQGQSYYMILTQEWGGAYDGQADPENWKVGDFALMDKDIADYVTYCDSDYTFDVNEISDLEEDLNQDWIDQSDTSNNQAVWENEWNTYGTCLYSAGYADGENDYFSQGLQAFWDVDIDTALDNAGIYATADTFYPYQQIADAIKDASGDPILLCRYDGTNYLLTTVVLCYDDSMQPNGCNSGDLPSDITDVTCPTDNDILWPSSDYYASDTPPDEISANQDLRAVSVDNGVDPVLVAIIAVVPAAAGLVGIAIGIYAFYKNRDKIQNFEFKEAARKAFFSVFGCLVSEPSEVEYPGVSSELSVKSYNLDAQAISEIPVLGEILTELPVGLGIKGNICRKIFKIVMCQKTTDLASEVQFGDYDLELLAIVDNLTPEVSLHVRKTLTGFRLKNLAVEQAKNVEIFTNFTDYFRSRDITQNEILIFRHSVDSLILYYTEPALRDASANVITPSVHAFTTEFTNVWHVSSIGEPILGKKIFCRCIVNLLKGHGGSYNIPQSTWSFYKEKKLDPLSIFRVLRHFEKNPGFQRAFTHLQVLGVVPTGVTAGEAWGEALWSLNDILARYTTKFSMNFPLNAETIEAWNDINRKLMADWLIKRKEFCLRHGFIESENQSTVVLPEELRTFSNYLFRTSNLEVPAALKQSNPSNPDESEITTEKQLKDLYARTISKKQQIKFKQSLGSHLNLTQVDEEEDLKSKSTNQEENDNGHGITAARLKKTNHAISQFDIITPDKLYADRGQQWYDDQVFSRGSKYTTEYAYSNKLSAQGQKEMEAMDDGNIKSKENPHKKNAFDLLARVWVIAKLQKTLIFVIALFLVIQLAFRVYAAYTTGLVSTAFTNYTSLSEIRKLLIQLIILVAGEVVFQVIAAIVITVFSAKVLKAFGRHLYKTILYQDVEFHERVQTGEKIMKLSSDSHAILNLIGSIIPNMFSSTMLLIGSIIACFVANWILGFIVAGYGGVLMITGVIYGYYGREKSREFRGAVGSVFRVSYDILTNINIIRRFGTEESEIEEFNKLIDKATDISSQLALGTTAFSAFGIGIGIFIRVLLLWVGGALIVGTSITTGTVLTVLFLAGIARQAIVTSYQNYGNLMQQVGSLERLFYLFEHQGRIHKPGVGRVLANVSGKLEFYQVSFAYPSRKDNAILKTINFQVQKGDVLGIFGASGSGKSTIGYLADVLYRPTYGYIYMDGAKVKELDVFWLRNHIGVLNNDATKILTASISDNITWGLGKVENTRVSQVCEKVGLDTWINTLPDNYDTIIGESGIQLSDIHKRKIAIARLMLRDPTVLIVDDITQGLGPETEPVLLDMLREFFQGKSVVVLSADMKVLRELKCNKFMKLVDGSLLPVDEIENSS